MRAAPSDMTMRAVPSDTIRGVQSEKRKLEPAAPNRLQASSTGDHFRTIHPSWRGLLVSFALLLVVVLVAIVTSVAVVHLMLRRAILSGRACTS